MSVFMTGATGFLGSYSLNHILKETDIEPFVLTRARSRHEAEEKLWKAMQLHVDARSYRKLLPRIHFVSGDLTAPRLGIDPATYRHLTREVHSILHIAASLNRRSSKACFNHNMRGTLSMINLARDIDRDHHLRRFSYVSTVAVAGMRHSETITEDASIDWDRSDYDPYGRTKKFCEHMIHELLPRESIAIYRPSIVMGDSRRPETTQFDMVRAFCALADFPVLPMRGNTRLDIVPADFVGHAIAKLHLKEALSHQTYHLSAGEASPCAAEIVTSLKRGATTRRINPRFVPQLQGGFEKLIDSGTHMKRGTGMQRLSTLLKVFLPYITYDTVFDNDRVVSELGEKPASFTSYCGDLYAFAKGVKFKYPFTPYEPRLQSVLPLGSPSGDGETGSSDRATKAAGGKNHGSADPSAKEEGAKGESNETSKSGNLRA